MGRSTLRRMGALLVSAAVLASLSIAATATPASAAKPTCQGQTATFVGTAKGEVIVGTAGRDVIVAKGGPDSIYGKGGNDLICAGTGNDLVGGGPGADTIWGQLGNDRLDGGPGPDFLAGQLGNDTLNGGFQVDKCYQGTGTGAVLNCELPAPPVAAPPPPPSDSDGDGIPDGSDACPTQGNQGYGVDASGCPNIPDMCAYLNNPSLDAVYPAHGPVTLRFWAGQSARWTLVAPGTVTVSDTLQFDDGTTGGGGGSASGVGFTAPKSGKGSFSWTTSSGVAWNISCTNPA